MWEVWKGPGLRTSGKWEESKVPSSLSTMTWRWGVAVPPHTSATRSESGQ
jgi:hypothetical protein